MSTGKEVVVHLSAAVPIKVGAGVIRRAESSFVPVRAGNLAMLLKDASAFRHSFPSSTCRFVFPHPSIPTRPLARSSRKYVVAWAGAASLAASNILSLSIW